MMERLREMFTRRKPPPEPEPETPEGESRIEEIADAKSKSDRTLARVNRVLSPEDARLRAAVSGTARGLRAPRRMGG